MVKKIIFVFAFINGCNTVLAQQIFRGSFLMSFSFSTKENMPPLLWNVDGDKIAIEIQDIKQQHRIFNEQT